MSEDALREAVEALEEVEHKLVLIEGKTKTVGSDWGHPEVSGLANDARKLLRAALKALRSPATGEQK